MRTCGMKKRQKLKGQKRTCPCGCYGKKLKKVPEPYKNDEKLKQKVKKWEKKHGIKLIKDIKNKIEGEE